MSNTPYSDKRGRKLEHLLVASRIRTASLQGTIATTSKEVSSLVDRSSLSCNCTSSKISDLPD